MILLSRSSACPWHLASRRVKSEFLVQIDGCSGGDDDGDPAEAAGKKVSKPLHTFSSSVIGDPDADVGLRDVDRVHAHHRIAAQRSH